jgi:pyruvate,water dikinase
MTSPAADIIPLAALRAADVSSAGGKAANLGELIAAGVPVPDGFVVSTSAYARAAASLTVGLSGGAADASALRGRFGSLTMPADLQHAIEHAYADLGGGAVAVRSSATAEDLPGATFAGQQDTFLDVEGPTDVVDAVRRCWASLWTDRAVAYRARLGIAPGEVRIAVVVQKLIPSDVAGVMFTANPVSGRRDEIVIDASPGLGEAVVSGEATPDHFVVGPHDDIRAWTAGGREVVHRATGATHDAPAQGQPVLTTAEVAALTRLGRRIRDHFRRPMDIEWALTGGATWIVQARPMTALPRPPQRLNRVQRLMSTVLGDYLQARPYPIDMTSWVPYGPVGMMARIVRDVGIGGVFDSLYHETDGIVDGAQIPMPHPRPRLVTAPWRLVRRARRHPLAAWRSDPRLDLFENALTRLDAVDTAAADWATLRALPRRVLQAVEPITTLRQDYLPATGLALARLALSLRARRARVKAGELLHGVPTWTTRGNDALAALARVAAAHPATGRAVVKGDLAGARRNPEFAAAFDEWVRTYGFRETASPIVITAPTVGESPGTVLSLVSLLMADAPQRHGDDAAPALPASIRSPGARARMAARISAAASGVAFREDSHALFTRPMPLLRRALLEIGRRLHASGVLDGPEDVYHLRLDEIEALPDGAGAEAQALRRVMIDRRRRRRALEGLPLLNIERDEIAYDGAVLVRGIAGGGGRVTGPVRIVRGAEEFGLLRAGDVLVCPYTNPSWTPLFQRAAAVVVDSGGPASHAAIVAREYGLAVVMGTGDATRVLHDGDLVAVDGIAGTVNAVRA